jgi:hypothetical protein
MVGSLSRWGSVVGMAERVRRNILNGGEAIRLSLTGGHSGELASSSPMATS